VVIDIFYNHAECRLWTPWIKKIGTLGMEMHNLFAIVCVALLMLIESASAQRGHPERTYSLTVSRHPNVELSDATVDEILAEASKTLKTCNVTFRREGVVRELPADTPSIIKSSSDRDAVHSQDGDIKVVKEIGFCRIKLAHRGCAWDPVPEKNMPQKKSMIVTEPRNAKLSGLVWAHEFGHRTGLWHRNGKRALMSPCPLKSGDVQITQIECDCFRGGPGSCKPKEPNPAKTCG
jgi:hypothetical protein